MKRRSFLASASLAGIGSMLEPGIYSLPQDKKSVFRYCLNTISISKQPLDIVKYLEIASEAGYDSVEIWVRDLEKYLNSEGSSGTLLKILSDKNLTVENGIGFAQWLAEGEAGFTQIKKEMELLNAVGCKRIAATFAGVAPDKPFDFGKAAERYHELLKLGRETGVMPQLEFWGNSKIAWHIGQALMIVTMAGDRDGKILADVYHMFRGNTSFDTLDMIDGSLIEIFHMNDFISSKPREEQKDSDRVYPGDGAAPFRQIMKSLKNMGGEKILSLELFNESYWKQEPLTVAKTGLRKMKEVSTLNN